MAGKSEDLRLQKAIFSLPFCLNCSVRWEAIEEKYIVAFVQSWVITSCCTVNTAVTLQYCVMITFYRRRERIRPSDPLSSQGFNVMF